MDPKYEINELSPELIMRGLTSHNIPGWLLIGTNWVRSSDIKVVKVQPNNAVQLPNKTLPMPRYPDRLEGESTPDWKSRVAATSYSDDCEKYDSAPYLYCVLAGGFTVGANLLEETANRLAHILVEHLSAS